MKERDTDRVRLREIMAGREREGGPIRARQGWRRGRGQQSTLESSDRFVLRCFALRGVFVLLL